MTHFDRKLRRGDDSGALGSRLLEHVHLGLKLRDARELEVEVAAVVAEVAADLVDDARNRLFVRRSRRNASRSDFSVMKPTA